MNSLKFGDVPGHEFHGNQWGADAHEAQAVVHDSAAKVAKTRDAQHYHQRAAVLHRMAAASYNRKEDGPKARESRTQEALRATAIADRITARGTNMWKGSMGKFGRNVVREVKRTGGLAY